MENKKNANLIAACQKSVETCESCSTSNKDVAGMENIVKLSIACKNICNEVLAAIKNSSKNLNILYKKCDDACTACAKECEKHAENLQCKACADACNKCATECKLMLSVTA